MLEQLTDRELAERIKYTRRAIEHRLTPGCDAWLSCAIALHESAREAERRAAVAEMEAARDALT